MGVYDRILITGGGGMLAKAVVRQLRARGLEPIALDRTALDIASSEAVDDAFRSHRPTLVINAAAYTKVDLAEQETEAANRVNGKGPDDPTNPVSVYGRSKLAGEQALRPGDLLIRTAWLYGPGGPCFPQTMINAARAGKPLKVVDDQTGSPTFTHDLAEATCNLIDADATGIYHVVNAGLTTWHDFTAAILEEFGLKTELSRTKAAEWKKLRPNSAIRPAYSVLDTSKYTQTTGKTMRDWRAALRDYHQSLDEA
jgi:dTDP-4-dehydrorhamnose reductase